MYESTITFTFDTICPWTYLAKKRLDKALATFNANPQNKKDVAFRLRLAPYQLYPDMPSTGEPKRTWYTREKYHDDPSKFAMYETVMASYASGLDFKFSWDGDVANTLDAHRVLQVLQGDAEELEDSGSDVRAFRDKYGGGGAAATPDKVLMSLYRQYFEEGQHPSAEATLLRACEEAGVDGADARRLVVEEGRDLGRAETRQMVRMAGINGVDSVPTVVFEGRRRDLTLVGAKEVEEYVKALTTIVKESS